MFRGFKNVKNKVKLEQKKYKSKKDVIVERIMLEVWFEKFISYILRQKT